jgi:hypothetical protein
MKFRETCAQGFIFFPTGVKPCAFYLQNGHCKFGSTCKFDHPMGTIRWDLHYRIDAVVFFDGPDLAYYFF